MCGVTTAHFIQLLKANMTNLITTISSRIARRAEQEARPAIPTQVAVEKVTTESNLNSRDIRIATFNV